MKAIVNIQAGGNAKLTVAYLLDPNAKSKRESMPAAMMTGSDFLVQVGERVADVFGEGIAPVSKAKKNEVDIVSALEARPAELRRRGKLTRHVVISAEFEDSEKITDDEINEKLRLAAEDFIDNYAPGSKYFAVLHRDSSQPHVHLEIENFDCSISPPQRINWSPVDVAEMQLMNWTEQFTMGKGSTKNAEKKNSQCIEKFGRPMLGRRKKDQRLGAKIEKLLAGKLKLRGNALVAAIERLNDSHGIQVNKYSPRGALLKNPSLSLGETRIRFDRIEKHFDNVLEFKRQQELAKEPSM